MENGLLKTGTASVSVSHTVLEHIVIEYHISEELFAIRFVETVHGHVDESCAEWIEHMKFDAHSSNFVFYPKVDRAVEKALQHWLETPNTRYHPTPLQWMESIRSLSLMSKEIGRDQPSDNLIKISEKGIADIIARLAVMASLQSLTDIDPIELQKKVRDIIVSGLPAVIDRKVAA